MDNIEKIWEIITTLTDEAQQAALDKCAELGYDTNRGEVPLDESFINLNAARLIIKDSVERNKLIQLPITVQKTLLSQLETISKSLINLVNGTDEVVNITQAIEKLNTAIWQYGLHNLSEEVLGYQEKLNQLKRQDLEIKALNAELRKGIKLKRVLEKLVAEFEKSEESIKENLEKSEEEVKAISSNLTSATGVNQQVSAILETAQKNDTSITQYLSSSKTSNAEVTAIETKIKEFYKSIDAYKEEISATKENAKDTIEENNSETDKLIGQLNTLEEQIKTQLQKATGITLFHSFEKRKSDLATSKNIWVIALAVLVIVSICLTIYVIRTTNDINAAFYIKLSLSLPLIYAIAFCTVQYSRERRLEEEYAFKSNISLSLIPYQELVEKMISENEPLEKEKYTSFMIDSIQKIFSSPTEKIFDAEKKEVGLSNKAIKQVNQISESIGKIIEPIIKGLIHK